MAIKFEFYESPVSNGEKSANYHARTISLRTVTTDQIARDIHEKSSLTTSDVKAVIVELSNEIAFHLGESERVHIEGIGYFQATLKCDKEIDPQKTRAQSVWFKSVKYRADQELKKKLKYIKTERSAIKSHSARLTNEEVDEKVSAFLAEGGFLTRGKLQAICKLTSSTAAKHIRRMREERKIKNINTPRHPIYVLVK